MSEATDKRPCGAAGRIQRRDFTHWAGQTMFHSSVDKLHYAVRRKLSKTKYEAITINKINPKLPRNNYLHADVQGATFPCDCNIRRPVVCVWLSFSEPELDEAKHCNALIQRIPGNVLGPSLCAQRRDNKF